MSMLFVWCLASPFMVLVQEARRGDALAARIEALARQAIEKEGVPGLSIAVGKDGELLFAGGYGYADAANGVLASKDTVYSIGSLSRQFTGVAVLQLAEQKRLSLDDPLEKWLPDFPTQGEAVTLRHLLANTSGLPGYEALAAAHGTAIDRDLGRGELFALFEKVPFEFAPGTKFSFHNSGYLLLSMVVAKASGEEYRDYVRTHLLRPIELDRTSFLPTAERPAGFSHSCKELSEERELEIPIGGAATTSTQLLGSTVLDLFRWQCALDDRILIGETSTAQMQAPARLSSGASTGYGFAMAVGDAELGRVLSHTGGIGGFRVRLAHYVDPRLTVIVLANCDSAPVERLEGEIARAALGRLPAETADLPIDRTELARLTGSWQIATQAIRTFERDGSLWFEYAGQPAFPLLYQGHRTFVAANDPKWRITFQGPPDRPATSFDLVRDGFSSVGKRMG